MEHLIYIYTFSEGCYIYIYAFSRHFYPKQLTVHSCYTYFCQYMCSLGIEPTTFALKIKFINTYKAHILHDHVP